MAHGFFGDFGDSLGAADAAELRYLLGEVDIAVPRRTRGRRSEHLERYCLVHYLRTLEQNGLLDFPFRVTKGESPDFCIEMGSQRLGLEVTEAGSEKHQAARTELEKAPPGSILEGNEIRRPGERLRGDPTVGDEAERWWTAEILEVIRRKTEKLASYQDLPDFHLLIFDGSEFALLTEWTITELPARLARALEEWRKEEAGQKRQFRRISVLRNRTLMYDVGGNSYLLPVPVSPSLPPLLPLERLGVAEEVLRAFCRQHAIRKLGFFGSVRTDRFGPHSDVDVLVEFEPGHRIGLLGLASVQLELVRLLRREVDLRTVPDLSRYFREEVVREKTDLAYVAG